MREYKALITYITFKVDKFLARNSCRSGCMEGNAGGFCPAVGHSRQVFFLPKVKKN